MSTRTHRFLKKLFAKYYMRLGTFLATAKIKSKKVEKSC